MFSIDKQRGKHTFSKEEKLKHTTQIDQLFREGKYVHTNGFTLVYLASVLSVTFPVQVAFSVPKRSFKHAVDRNRIKRLMREAYRHRKLALYEKLVAAQLQVMMMWVYKGREVPDLKAVEVAADKLLKRVADAISK